MHMTQQGGMTMQNNMGGMPMPMGGMPMPMGMPNMGIPTIQPQFNPQGRGAGPRGPNDDEATLWVGNIKNMNDERLYSIFQAYGSVKSARVLKDSYSGESRGFGFVTFAQKSQAQNAMNMLRYVEVDGTILNINWKKDSPRNLPPNANLYIKNLDRSVDEKFLFESMCEFGDVVSLVIRRDGKGNSLGYGYVQFRKEEDAKLAIEKANGRNLGSSAISVELFKSKGSRQVNSKNNLYVNNFPASCNSQEALYSFIDKVFGAYGSIVSKYGSFSEKYNAFAGFVAYSDPKDAAKAKEELDGYETEGAKLSVVFAMTKDQRRREFERNSSGINSNETNFHIKSLKLEVTAEDLKKVFSKFGEVDSTTVKSHKFNGKGGDSEMGFGFVSFKNKEDAKRCYTEHRSDPEVKALIHANHRPGQDFLNYHQSRNIRQKFNKVTKKNSQSTRSYTQQFASLMKMFQQQMRAMQRGQNKFNRGGQGPMNPMMMNMFNQGNRGNQGMMPNMMPGMMPGMMPNANMMQANPMMQNGGMAPMLQQTPQQQPQRDAKWLKANIDEFEQLSQQEQKTILGTLMYNQVIKFANSEHVPKITGMLIDLEVLSVKEVADILDDEDILKERIEEATKIIDEDMGQN